MTLKGRHPLPAQARLLMKRLMHLHMLTHPKTVGRMFGVTSKYVQEQWRDYTLEDITSTHDAFLELTRWQMAHTSAPNARWSLTNLGPYTGQTEDENGLQEKFGIDGRGPQRQEG